MVLLVLLCGSSAAKDKEVFLIYGGAMHRMVHGGKGEIRTRGTVARTTDFKSVALDHSATSPWWIFSRGRSVAYGEIFSKGNQKPLGDEPGVRGRDRDEGPRRRR